MQNVKADTSYEYFKSVVVEQVREKVEGRVEIQKIKKNNGLELDGLTIIEGKVNISPTIYLNYYYDKFLQCGLNVVLKEILDTYEKNKPKTSIDISFFTDTEKVRSIIKMKIVNYERNIALLEKVPHIKYLDLAIIFYAEIENTEDGLATILIHNHHMKYWNFTTEEIFKMAEENMAEDFKIVPIMDIVNRVMEKEFIEVLEQKKTVEIGVVTNHRNINGAVAMVNSKMLQEYMKRHHAERLIIIPSSIHEVLLIPCDTETSVASFKEMVREVNATQLLPEEVLSDNAYIYDGSNIKLIE